MTNVNSESNINNLLYKEMDRKEFIIHLGLILLTLTGISGFIKTFLSTIEQRSHRTSGYGSSPYGGSSKE